MANEKYIFRTVFGSRLFGTSLETSDTDYKSVFIPSSRDLILQNPVRNIQKSTGNSSTKNTVDDIDDEGYSIKEFFKHVTNGQTNAIDMLFAPNPELQTNEWKYIVANRDKLLSRKIDSFIGYCMQQQSKYNHKIERFQEVERVLKLLFDTNPNLLVGDFCAFHKISTEGMTKIEPIQVHSNGTIINHLSVCEKKVPFTIPVKEAIKIYKKLYDDYGSRAKEAITGSVDWKSMYHATRIAEECVELLTTGFVTLPRPNAEQLVKIRKGEVRYEEVSEYVVHLVNYIKTIDSKLPEKPDHKWIENFLYDLHLKQIQGN